jgi:hypothetical protein
MEAPVPLLDPLTDEILIGCQLNVAPRLFMSVIEMLTVEPEQILCDTALALATGSGLTVIDVFPVVPAHPFAEVDME